MQLTNTLFDNTDHGTALLARKASETSNLCTHLENLAEILRWAVSHNSTLRCRDADSSDLQ